MEGPGGLNLIMAAGPMIGAGAAYLIGGSGAKL